MIKCDCYHTRTEWHALTEYERGLYEGMFAGETAPSHREDTISECWGTKERDQCTCGGDRCKCDFYEEVRKESEQKEKAELENIELEFYREWIIQNNLQYQLFPAYRKWKAEHSSK